MKVLIAGATGTLGMPIVTQLIGADHDVTGITRSSEGAEKLRRVGASAIVADAMDREALLRAGGGLEADAVLHELTALKKAPAGHGGMEATDVFRVQGTANLLDLAREVGARRFVTQSIVFGYGYADHGDRLEPRHDHRHERNAGSRPDRRGVAHLRGKQPAQRRAERTWTPCGPGADNFRAEFSDGTDSRRGAGGGDCRGGFAHPAGF